MSSPTMSLNGANHEALCEKLGVDPSMQAVAVLLIGKVRTQKRSAVSTGRFFWFCSKECVSTVASAPASSR